MSRTNLIQWGGGAAVLAGFLRVIASFTPTTMGEALHVFYFTIDVLLLLGILGWYGFQRRATGRWGLGGFVLALIGSLLLITHDVVQTGVNLYPIAALCFALGSSVLASGAWAAQTFPRWASAFVITSTVVGILGVVLTGGTVLFVLSGVLFGIGFARVGLTVWLHKALTSTES